MELTNMIWRPAMIRLTQTARPDIDDGGGTPIFIQPEFIVAIHRQSIQHRDTDGKPVYDRLCCTVVTLSNGGPMSYFVNESPEEIANLRDGAYGFAPRAPETLSAVDKPSGPSNLRVSDFRPYADDPA